VSKAARVRLRGGPEHSVTWVEIDSDGCLVIELFDHSDQAHSALGNDVAYALTVAAANKTTLLRRLLAGQIVMLDAADRDALLLQLLSERFDSYFDAQAWLLGQHIPFAKSFDGEA